MNLKTFLTSTLVAMAFAAPLVSGEEARERAYTETLLCSDVAPGAAALFEHYFGDSAEAVA